MNATNDKVANASTDTIAVIKTQLPYIDRRALSQAWFSAFHLATGGSASAAVFITAPKAASPIPSRSRVQRRRPSTTPSEAGIARSAYARRSSDVSVLESSGAPARRRARSSPADMAVEAPVPVKNSVVQASFTLAVDGARVAIHVRHEAGKLRVIALCSPRHIEIVQRALAKTALAMRARGAAIETLVQSSESEGRA